MEQYKLTKINSGSAVHLAEHFVTISNVQGYSVYCGSGKTGSRNILRYTNKEVNVENITCKKCAKRYEELQQEAQTVEKSEGELLREYVEKHGRYFSIPKR